MKNVFSVLQSFLGQVSLSLDLDVETGGDIRDQDVDQLADTKHDVLEDDHEGKLESENLPVDRSEHPKLVSKSSVVAFRLELYFPITKIPTRPECGGGTKFTVLGACLYLVNQQ